ncbi:DUF4269 domain-containing protein [Reichenbachiella ulvae]|uniref:DUF4269 domain-containing protein n=1 Tax=Reichenbachiella ulvae TaxID=2980104 RepID=A0ABT3CWT5_9BACT|nr:DUF4269 domain-containing protein [Reichenbachiella ulvae]MCV9387945.1 DUF4269 domain-containing protein [Reichenbachiella ulvae]
MNFLTLDYLSKGSPRQVEAFRLLQEQRWMEWLQPYHPILVGTIPINIDVAGSDLDIICEVSDLEHFGQFLKSKFQFESSFQVHLKSINQIASVVAKFEKEGYDIEIFGQNVPTQKQDAYRHMLVEHRILQERGDRFRKQIIDLKKQGVKTEPAFAQLLGLKGNPYQALLDLE